MKCRFCGEEFEQRSRGWQVDFCQKDECRKMRKKETQAKYLAKKKAEEETKEDKVEPMTQVMTVAEKETIYVQPIKESYGDIIEIARQLGALRYGMVMEVIKLKEEVSKADKTEQDLLHMLENAERLNADDAVKMALLIKQNREKRRASKDRYFLLSSLINQIPVKNPEKFVRNGIEMVKNQTYNFRELQEGALDEEEKEV